MSKGKKVAVGMVSGIVVLLVMGAVWYLNTCIECEDINVLNLFSISKFVVSIVNALLFFAAAFVTEGISNLIAGFKENVSQKMAYLAIVLFLFIGFMNYPVMGIISLSAFWTLFTLVTFLLMMFTYMREIPYDCFGSKEPLFAVGLWITLLGLLTGFFSKNLGIAIFVFAILATAYVKKVGHVVQPWMIAGIVASVIGLVLGVLWPAFESKSWDSVLNVYADTQRYSDFGVFVLRGIFMDLVCPIVILVLLCVVLKEIYSSFVGREVTYVLIAASVAFVSIVFETEFGGEKAFGTVALLTVALLVLAKRLFEKKESLKKGFALISVFLGLLGIYRIISLIWL